MSGIPLQGMAEIHFTVARFRTNVAKQRYEWESGNMLAALYNRALLWFNIEPKEMYWWPMCYALPARAATCKTIRCKYRTRDKCIIQFLEFQ